GMSKIAAYAAASAIRLVLLKHLCPLTPQRPACVPASGLRIHFSATLAEAGKYRAVTEYRRHAPCLYRSTPPKRCSGGNTQSLYRFRNRGNESSWQEL